VGIPLVIAVNYLGGLAFALLIALAALVAEIEVIRLLRAGSARPSIVLAVPAAVALCVAGVLIPHPQSAWIGTVSLLIVLACGRFLVPSSRTSLVSDWAATIAGTVYVGLLLAHLGLLRQLDRGAWWVALVLVVTWAYDTGAYFCGRLWGSRPFMAHISPKKTVEGVIGGLTASSLVGLAGVWTVGMTWWQGLIFGLLGGAIGQLGDLVESMLKRQAGVKDSGALMPGHGGLLDRIDSLLFTGVLGYYAAALLGHGA
jgi:phosphatidate cytidylyltransferase